MGQIKESKTTKTNAQSRMRCAVCSLLVGGLCHVSS
jgi:hypothetical protein